MTKQYPTKQYLNEVISNREFAEGVPPEIVIVMARQLLASMEQEPVAYIDPFTFKNFSTFRAGETDNKRMGREWAWAMPDSGLIPVYAAPQLPQPAVVAPSIKPDWMNNEFSAGWNACRAAMLQGAEPVSQPYTLREGWVAVPVDMTPEQMRAVQLNSELGAYAAANLSGAYSLFREFWDVAIAASNGGNRNA